MIGPTKSSRCESLHTAPRTYICLEQSALHLKNPRQRSYKTALEPKELEGGGEVPPSRGGPPESSKATGTTHLQVILQIEYQIGRTTHLDHQHLRQ